MMPIPTLAVPAFAALLAALPAAAAADEGTFARLFVSAGPTFDSNLFATSDRRQPDVVTRITPGLAWRRTTSRWTAGGRLSADLDRYARHPQLTSALSRQQGGATVDYRASRRLTVSGGVELLRTSTPGELTGGAGLLLGRTPAIRLAAHARASRQIRATAVTTVEYSLTDDAFAGGAARTDRARIGVSRQLGGRTRLHTAGTAERTAFRIPGAGRAATFGGAVTAGFEHAITRRLSTWIEAGPRADGRALQAELGAGIRVASGSATLALHYVQTAFAVMGLAGPMAMQRLAVPAAWNVAPSLRVRVEPAFARTAAGAQAAGMASVAAEAEWRLAPGLAIAAGGSTAGQRGSVHPGFHPAAVVRHEFSLRVMVEPPARRRR